MNRFGWILLNTIISLHLFDKIESICIFLYHTHKHKTTNSSANRIKKIVIIKLNGKLKSTLGCLMIIKFWNVQIIYLSPSNQLKGCRCWSWLCLYNADDRMMKIVPTHSIKSCISHLVQSKCSMHWRHSSRFGVCV